MNKINKSFYRSPLVVLLVLLTLPILLAVIVIKLWINASQAIWKKEWKLPYKLAWITALWSIFFIVPALSGSPKPDTLGAKTEVQKQIQQPTIEQVTSTPAIINSPTPTAIPNQAPTATPTPVPTKVYIAPTKYIAPTSAPTQAPAVQQESGLSNDNYYTNSQGNEVHSPAYSDSVPAGASAICGGGTYSFSQSRRGTCSHHGGVAQWL